MSVRTDIKNCRMEDILIACMDGHTVFDDTVKPVFFDIHIQHCIVHRVRKSTKVVLFKDLKVVYRYFFGQDPAILKPFMISSALHMNFFEILLYPFTVLFS